VALVSIPFYLLVSATLLVAAALWHAPKKTPFSVNAQWLEMMVFRPMSQTYTAQDISHEQRRAVEVPHSSR
jgi:hypothetical protein